MWGVAAFLLVGLVALPAPAEDAHGDTNQAGDAQGASDAAHGAADTAHGAADAAHGAGEAAHASPNLFSVDPGLLIWTIITFVVVLVVLRLVAWKPLMASLAERQRNIEGAIAEAQKARSEAENLLARHESMMNQAKDDARAILDEARKDGKRLQEEIRVAAQKEAQDFKDRAQREIELQKDSAVQEIWDLAGNLSTELASRILGRSLEAADQDRLVKELIDEMRREGAGR